MQTARKQEYEVGIHLELHGGQEKSVDNIEGRRRDMELKTEHRKNLKNGFHL